MKPAADLSTAHHGNRRPKLALLVNIISPARIPLYDGLAAHFDLLLLHGGAESNRDTWDDVGGMLPEARVVKAWGWQIRLARKVKDATFDYRYLHIRPGYLWHLLRFRPDVVVSNEMGFRTLLALFYGMMFHTPVWVWWGGTLHTEHGIGSGKRFVRRIISRWASRWISYGRSSTEYLSSLGIDQHRIIEIQNAVDERRFFNSPEAAFQPPQRPVLLHVGQFTRRKGVELLLRAASILQKEGAQFSLLLVGSGPEKTAAERLATELGLTNVYFHAPRQPEDMPAVYRSADVLIFPTLEDVWGLVANEAVLSRLPVLCSKYAGCADELFDADCIFDPENSQEFTEKLRTAIAGGLPRPDLSRVRTSRQLVADLVHALKGSLPKPLPARAGARPYHVSG
jgi:glycosyltransferase involved in cell wall biosynthesis